MSAAASIATYIAKPIAIAGAKHIIDNAEQFIDADTRKKLKELLGEQEDVRPKLDKISDSIKKLSEQLATESWKSTWALFDAYAIEITTRAKRIRDEKAMLKSRVEKEGVKLAERNEDIPIELMTKINAHAAPFHQICREFIDPGEKGVVSKGYTLIAGLSTPKIGLNSSTVMAYVHKRLVDQNTDVLTYSKTMADIISYITAVIVLISNTFDEAKSFCDSMPHLYPEGFAPESNPNLLDRGEIQSFYKNYVSLTDKAHQLENRLRDLAATKTQIGLRSANWPASQKKDYDCYLTGCADGIPRSKSQGIGTGTRHGQILQHYTIGVTESRLTHGFPQIFPAQKAIGSNVYKVKEISKVYRNLVDDAGRLGNRVGLTKPDPEDKEVADRLNEQLVPEKRLLEKGWGILKRQVASYYEYQRVFDFKHDRASQSWTVEIVSHGGEEYVQFKHVASGQYLGAMRDSRVYLTRQPVQKLWQLIVRFTSVSDEKGAADSDKLLFVLRSAHLRKHAIHIGYPFVVAERGANTADPEQCFQIITW